MLGEILNNRPSFSAISGETDRFRRVISLIAIGVAPIAFATAYALNPNGFIKSSNNTSPGCTGGIRSTFISLMVIHEFDFMRIALMPPKTQAVLVVHANAELPSALSLKLLHPVPRGHAQIHQSHRFVQIRELSPRDILNVASEHFYILPLKNVSGVFTREA